MSFESVLMMYETPAERVCEISPDEMGARTATVRVTHKDNRMLED